MSFPRYPEYKASGVEWLGEVPTHWEILPIKRIVAVPITDGPHETPQFFDEGIPFVSAEAVSSGRIDFSKVRACISAEDNERYSLKYSPKLNDILMVKSGATTGITAIVEDRTDFNIWSPLAVIRCGGGAVPHFVLNFMRSRNFLEAVTLNWSFGTQQNIGMGVIENLSCTLPPPAEQTFITAFLGRETAKIDELVAEQRRLMELLKEKRQAVISHAVTKGLNPQAPLKPSGINWLGDVPEHWSTSQSRRMFSVRSEPAYEMDQMLTASQKYGVLFQSDFVEREGRRVVEVIMGKESLKHVEPDDFIISMRSFQGGLEWCRLRGSTSFHYVMITPIKWVHPPFFAHLFKSTTYIQALRATTDLIRDGQELRFSNFVQVDLPVVPMEEQVQIALYLDAETAKFDALTAEAGRAIDLLQERRTALISAAVTGQIDVRNAVPA